MKEYTVELRATPDTDEIEIQSIKNAGGPTSPQTVYHRLSANSYEEACKKAIDTELLFGHRRDRTLVVEVKGKKLHIPLKADVWVFGTRKPTGCCGDGSNSCQMKPVIDPYQEYNEFSRDLAKYLDELKP